MKMLDSFEGVHPNNCTSFSFLEAHWGLMTKKANGFCRHDIKDVHITSQMVPERIESTQKLVISLVSLWNDTPTAGRVSPRDGQHPSNLSSPGAESSLGQSKPSEPRTNLDSCPITRTGQTDHLLSQTTHELVRLTIFCPLHNMDWSNWPYPVSN